MNTTHLAASLVALSLLACSSGNGDTADRPADAQPSASATATRAADCVPTGSSATGDGGVDAPKATPTLRDECAGGYRCADTANAYGDGYAEHLHAEGARCLMTSLMLDTLELAADGSVLSSGTPVGTWQGDSIAFTFTHNTGGVPMECVWFSDK